MNQQEAHFLNETEQPVTDVSASPKNMTMDKTSSHLEQLSTDIIVDILACCPDFTSLNNMVRTSLAINSLFNTHKGYIITGVVRRFFGNRGWKFAHRVLVLQHYPFLIMPFEPLLGGNT